MEKMRVRKEKEEEDKRRKKKRTRLHRVEDGQKEWGNEVGENE